MDDFLKSNASPSNEIETSMVNSVTNNQPQAFTELQA